MAIKSKKYLAELRRQREQEKEMETYWDDLERDGPNGVAAESNDDHTLVSHWDDSHEVRLK